MRHTTPDRDLADGDRTDWRIRRTIAPIFDPRLSPERLAAIRSAHDALISEYLRVRHFISTTSSGGRSGLVDTHILHKLTELRTAYVQLSVLETPESVNAAWLENAAQSLTRLSETIPRRASWKPAWSTANKIIAGLFAVLALVVPLMSQDIRDWSLGDRSLAEVRNELSSEEFQDDVVERVADVIFAVSFYACAVAAFLVWQFRRKREIFLGDQAVSKVASRGGSNVYHLEDILFGHIGALKRQELGYELAYVLVALTISGLLTWLYFEAGNYGKFGLFLVVTAGVAVAARVVHQHLTKRTWR